VKVNQKRKRIREEIYNESRIRKRGEKILRGERDMEENMRGKDNEIGKGIRVEREN